MLLEDMKWSNYYKNVVYLVTVMAFVVLNFSNLFIYDIYEVDGYSMYPTFDNNERIETQHYYPAVHQLHFYDVIIFKAKSGDTYIKRLIGLPGDIITIQRGRVYRNYKKIDEAITTYGNLHIQLREGQYFVLGDNRNYSLDSRNMERVGLIGEQDIYSFTSRSFRQRSH